MVVKIALFGPKPYFLDGHNAENKLRDSIRDQIRSILHRIRQECGEDTVIVGVTGLNIGVEQDFASICRENNIEYMVLSAHEEEHARLPQIPGLSETYHDLLTHCLNHRILSPGSFTNRKQGVRNKQMVNMADIVIVVDYPKHSKYTNKTILELVAKAKKRLIQITPKYVENAEGSNA